MDRTLQLELGQGHRAGNLEISRKHIETINLLGIQLFVEHWKTSFYARGQDSIK